MFTYLVRLRQTFYAKFLSTIITLGLTFSPAASYAQNINLFNLPVPGAMVTTTPAFTPVLLRGITLFPEDPLRFDFIIDAGQSGFEAQALSAESERLVKYFLASMTMPKDDLWVNLSPYENERIISDELAKTELGRDLLSQDYLLKQLTASLMYPEDELGDEFWTRVRKLAKERFGTDELPINTFNKVWILPENATVFENGESAYIVNARLKVMLDQDYMALDQNIYNKNLSSDQLTAQEIEKTTKISAEIIKEVILPEIEKEVNEGENFAPLRQIYYSLILARWYKETIQNSLLTQVYADKSKVVGIDDVDAGMKQEIYDQYIAAYQKGVFNYIREDYDRLSAETIPRKYFSGGIPMGANFSGDFNAGGADVLASPRGPQRVDSYRFVGLGGEGEMVNLTPKAAEEGDDAQMARRTGPEDVTGLDIVAAYARMERLPRRGLQRFQETDRFLEGVRETGFNWRGLTGTQRDKIEDLAVELEFSAREDALKALRLHDAALVELFDSEREAIATITAERRAQARTGTDAQMTATTREEMISRGQEIIRLTEKNIVNGYDVRGAAVGDGATIILEYTYTSGVALGYKLRQQFSGKEGKPLHQITYDHRSTGPALMEAFIQGLTEQGVDVVWSDEWISTPAANVIARLEEGYHPDSTSILTASHNPFTFHVGSERNKDGSLKDVAPENGFKVSIKDEDGYHRGIYGQSMFDILQGAFNDDVTQPLPEAERGVARKVELLDLYVSHLETQFKKMIDNAGLTLEEAREKLVLVVDTGNAVMGPVASKVLDRLGLQYELLYGDAITDENETPDHTADPSQKTIYEERLPREIMEIAKKYSSDKIVIGIALDGDGDRIGSTDEGGTEFLSPTKQNYILYSMLKEINPDMKGLLDVRIGEEVRELMGYPRDTMRHSPGWALVRNVIREEGADVAHEGSMHVMMRQFDDPNEDAIDDGLFAAIFMAVNAVRWNKEGKSIRKVLDSREWYPQLEEELRPNVDEGDQPGLRYEIMPEIATGISESVAAAFEGAEIIELGSYKGSGDFEPGARLLIYYDPNKTGPDAYIGAVLVRASNTAAKLSSTAQGGRDEGHLPKLALSMRDVFLKYPQVDPDAVHKTLDKEIDDAQMSAAVTTEAEKRIGLDYWRGNIKTQPINGEIRASQEGDVVVIANVSEEEALRLEGIGVRSLAAGEGTISDLAAGASSRQSIADTPESVNEMLDGRDIKSKAAVPLVVVDGKVVTYLDAFGQNVRRLFDAVKSEANRAGVEDNSNQNEVLFLSNDNYRAEHDALIAEADNYGLGSTQIRFIHQALGTTYAATPADLEKLKAKDKFATDADYRKAQQYARGVQVKFENGDTDAVIMPNQRDPLGHGEYLIQLISSGELRHIIRTGKKWIYTRNVDNVAATFDKQWLRALGKFLSSGVDFMPEVSLRAPGQNGGSLSILSTGQIIAEDPNLEATKDANGNVIVNPHDNAWINDAAAFSTPAYVLSLARRSGQSFDSILDEYLEADDAKLLEMGQRARDRLPKIIDAKLTKDGLGYVKVETNMWMSTVVADPSMKIEAIGVGNARAFPINEFEIMNPAQREQALADLRFLPTKNWKKTADEIEKARVKLANDLGREPSAKELQLVVETYEGNELLFGEIVNYILSAELVTPGVLDEQMAASQIQVRPLSSYKAALEAAEIFKEYYDQMGEESKKQANGVAYRGGLVLGHQLIVREDAPAVGEDSVLTVNFIAERNAPGVLNVVKGEKATFTQGSIVNGYRIYKARGKRAVLMTPQKAYLVRWDGRKKKYIAEIMDRKNVHIAGADAQMSAALEDITEDASQEALRQLIEAAQASSPDELPDSNFFKTGVFDKGAPRLGFLNVPSLDNVSSSLEDFVRRTAGMKHLIFIGMGGSINTVKALNGILGEGLTANVYTYDQMDPLALKEILDQISDELDQTMVVSISKSALTKETHELSNNLRDVFEGRGLNVNDHYTWFIDAGKESELASRGWEGVGTMPIQVDGKTDIGGRNTAPTTNIFYAPLIALKGNDIDAVKAIHEKFIAAAPELRESARKTAMAAANANTPYFGITVPESNRLALETWFTQLIQESLGGKIEGLEPKTIVASSERPAPDYFFNIETPTDGDPIVAMMYATYYMEVFTALIAHHYGINPITQDNVEIYKSKMRELADASIPEAEAVSPGELASQIQSNLTEKHKFIEVVLYAQTSQEEVDRVREYLQARFDQHVFVFIGSDWNHHSYQGAPDNSETLFVIAAKNDFIESIDGVGQTRVAQNTKDLKVITYATYETLEDKAIYVGVNPAEFADAQMVASKRISEEVFAPIIANEEVREVVFSDEDGESPLTLRERAIVEALYPDFGIEAKSLSTAADELNFFRDRAQQLYDRAKRKVYLHYKIEIEKDKEFINSIESLDLSKRADRAVRESGATTIEGTTGITQLTEAQILKVYGVSGVTVVEIKRKLAARDLKLADAQMAATYGLENFGHIVDTALEPFLEDGTAVHAFLDGTKLDEPTQGIFESPHEAIISALRGIDASDTKNFSVDEVRPSGNLVEIFIVSSDAQMAVRAFNNPTELRGTLNDRGVKLVVNRVQREGQPTENVTTVTKILDEGKILDAIKLLDYQFTQDVPGPVKTVASQILESFQNDHGINLDEVRSTDAQMARRDVWVKELPNSTYEGTFQNGALVRAGSGYFFIKADNSGVRIQSFADKEGKFLEFESEKFGFEVPITVGRAADNYFVLADTLLSRKHFVFRVFPTDQIGVYAISITDKGSKNGTRVLVGEGDAQMAALDRPILEDPALPHDLDDESMDLSSQFLLDVRERNDALYALIETPEDLDQLNNTRELIDNILEMLPIYAKATEEKSYQSAIDAVRDILQEDLEVLDERISEITRSLPKGEKSLVADDAQMAQDLGGIDFNNIDVDRTGSGINIQFDPAQIDPVLNSQIKGFMPVMINITPLPSLIPYLGLAPEREEEEEELVLSKARLE